MSHPLPPTNTIPKHRAPLPETAVAAGLMCIAVTLFACLDASAKYVITVYQLPAEQVTWIRFLGQFLGLLVLVPACGLLSLRQLFTTRTFTWQIVRSVLMAATTLLNFLALKTLRLDQTVTIFFLAPLVLALVAGPVLGEWVGWRRLMAILVGFFGIVVAVRPGFVAISPGVVFAFAAMSALALFMLLTRHIRGIDPPLVTLFYSMFAGVFAGLPWVVSGWVNPPDAWAWLILASLGVFGGAGHYLLILAHERAPASTLAPFIYFQLIGMITLGYLIFNVLPDGWTLTGASIVIVSGIYLFHRERLRKDETLPPV